MAIWTPKVELALASDPMAASPTWTDITAYVEPPIEITFGRPDEFSQAQPATMRLRLKNYDGRFTMGYTSGAYYPNVKVGKRIRFTVTRSAVTYPRFDGHVNEWPTAWLVGGTGLTVADITATDRMKRLGQLGEFRAMVSEEILRDAIAADVTHGSAYYPLSEQTGARSAGNITKQLQDPALIIQRGSGGTIEFGQGTGPGTDELPAPLFTRVDTLNGKYLTARLRTGVGQAGITLEAFMRADPGTVSASIAGLADPFDNRILLSVNSSGTLTVLSWQAGLGEVYRLDSAGTINDNTTHHVAVTESRSGSTVTAVLYLDGAQVATTTYTGTKLMTANRLFIGGDPWKRWGTFPGTLSHVAAHSAVLSAARIATHYNAGVNGLQGESADTRIGRFADWISFPTGDRNLDSSAATMGFQQTSGVQPVEAMRQVEALEQGPLFMSRDGKLTFHARSRRYNQSPAFTLAATNIADDATFPGDDFGVVNDMTVTRPDGASARYTDQSSIDSFGLYRDSAEIPAGSTDELLSAASWRVLNYGTPRARIPGVSVEVAKLEIDNPSLVPSVLNATISTKLRVGSLPSNAPSLSVDLFVEGATERYAPESWQIAFNTSPGEIYDVWQLGVAGHSELGVTTRVAMRTTAAAAVGIYSDTYSDTY